MLTKSIISKGMRARERSDIFCQRRIDHHFAAFTIIEPASFLDISPSLAARFSYPINLAVGPYCDSARHSWTTRVFESKSFVYSSLLTPLTEMTLSLIFLLNAFGEAASALGATFEAFSIMLSGSDLAAWVVGCLVDKCCVSFLFLCFGFSFRCGLDFTDCRDLSSHSISPTNLRTVWGRREFDK